MTTHVLIIGAQRCGTTYLHHMLDAHPDVVMARPVRPEPKVFLSDASVSHGREWYLQNYFSHRTGESVLGEKSTSYIEDPEAPRRILEVLGPTKILVILRDPVERAVSNWQFSTANGLETRPLEAALWDNLAGSREWNPASTSVSPFAYLERGRFVDYLDPWLAAFPGLVHVQLLADLRDQDSALEQLYRTIGVDPAFRPPTRRRPVNVSRHPSPTMPTELTTALRDYFAPSDRALSERLGRDLPWQP